MSEGLDCFGAGNRRVFVIRRTKGRTLWAVYKSGFSGLLRWAVSILVFHRGIWSGNITLALLPPPGCYISKSRRAGREAVNYSSGRFEREKKDSGKNT